MGMACACMKDECDQDCEVFETVADVKNPNMEWHMRDEKRRYDRMIYLYLLFSLD